jgi:hypothetical protein
VVQRVVAAILVAVLGATTARADEAAPAAASASDLLRFGMWDDEGWYQEGYFQGDQRLGRDAFLIAAGRRDVVDRVKHRRWLRIGLLGGGALIGLGGLAYMLTRPSCDDVVDGPGPGNPLQDCLDDRGEARLLGTLITIAGGGTMIGGFALGHLRPDRAELRAIAHAHNQRQRPPTQGTAIVVAPTVSPRSAGVVLSFSF